MGDGHRWAIPRAQRHTLFHLVWAVTVAGLVGGAVTTADAQDASPFVVPFGISVFWGCASVALMWLGGEKEKPPVGESRREAKRRRARERTHARRHAPVSQPRPPWRMPYLLGYVAALVGGVGLALYVGSPAPGSAVTVALLYPLAMLLGGLSGVALSLLGLAMALIVVGVRVLGGVVVTGRAGDRPASRALSLGPFVATLALLLLPVVLAGGLAVDSPYRRDLLPLLGVIRDGVVVTHPTLLLAGQAATFALVAGLALGVVIHVYALSRGSRTG